MNELLKNINDAGIDSTHDGSFWYFPSNVLGSNQDWHDMPNIVNGDFMIGGRINNCKIEYFSRVQEVHGDVRLDEIELTSLSGIGKMCFKQIKGNLFLNNSIQSSILGLMIIKNFEGVIKDFLPYKPDKFLTKKRPDNIFAFDIINAHIESEDPDILDCQEELITNGFKEYAKL